MDFGKFGPFLNTPIQSLICGLLAEVHVVTRRHTSRGLDRDESCIPGVPRFDRESIDSTFTDWESIKKYDSLPDGVYVDGVPY